MKMKRRMFLGLLLAGAATSLTMTASEPAFAKSPLALTGYDPVSYFTGRAPKRGNSEFTAEYKGVTYQFASAANRDAFSANPKRFAPQYGGYCAYGVSRGYKVGVDPLAYKVVSDKLYLNYSRSVQRTWSRDIRGYIEKADKNWPSLN